MTTIHSLSVLDIKSASLDVLSMLLRSADPEQVRNELSARLARRPKAFSSEPFLLDLSALDDSVGAALPSLFEVLNAQGVRIIGVRHASAGVGEQARALGWGWFPAKLERQGGGGSPVEAVAATIEPPPVENTAIEPAGETPPTPATPAAELATGKTLVVDRPVRAGQQVYARDSNLVVLALVSSGAELIADGDIHVYAPMRGRALAGARGNIGARIFVQHMSAELVSIAGVYRTLEDVLPDTLHGQAVQVFLDGSKLVMAPMAPSA